ncbi:unnamed protein product [Phytomonas sp. EM1]|nr:unnamed protein product [Phytomonas sp. EM1]|eukprot:CCW59731.1 unnamed protein product [Phytomonas sp. isolate EM1]
MLVCFSLYYYYYVFLNEEGLWDGSCEISCGWIVIVGKLGS